MQKKFVYSSKYLLDGGGLILLLLLLLGGGAFLAEESLGGAALTEETTAATVATTEVGTTDAVITDATTESAISEVSVASIEERLALGAELSKTELAGILKNLKVEFPANENPRLLTIEKDEMVGEIVDGKKLVLQNGAEKTFNKDIYAFVNNEVTSYSSAYPNDVTSTSKDLIDRLNKMVVVEGEENGFYKTSFDDGSTSYIKKEDLRPVLLKEQSETGILPLLMVTDSTEKVDSKEADERQVNSDDLKKAFRDVEKSNQQNDNGAANEVDRLFGNTANQEQGPEEPQCERPRHRLIWALVPVHYVDFYGRRFTRLERRLIPAAPDL